MTEQEMLKEALEWQKHIRKLITATDDDLYHKRSKVFDWLLERVQELEQQNKRYREALEFYANKINYLTFIENGKSNIEHDQGEKARQALEESE